MDEVLKVHLSTLAEIMLLLNDQYQEQLDDWLNSNYSYVKRNKPRTSASSEQDETIRNLPVPKEVSRNFNNQQTIKDKLKEAREKGTDSLILDADGNPIGVDPEDIARAQELESGSRNIADLKSLEPEIPAVVLNQMSKVAKTPAQVAAELELLNKLQNGQNRISIDSSKFRRSQ
jgi:hypothetical protein